MQAFVRYEEEKLKNFSHEEVVEFCKKFLNYIKNFQNKKIENSFFRTSNFLWCKYNYRQFINEQREKRLQKGISLKTLINFERR